MEEKKYVKALEVIEDCHIKSGHKIRLYGKETTVTGFHASYNDGIEKWETIILTEGRGDPFERSLDAIEVLPDQSDAPDHPRAVWVKASNPQIKDGDYVAKFRPPGMNLQHDYVGMAFVKEGYIRFACPPHYNITWRMGHQELQYVQILDESGAAAAGREDAVTIFEELWDEHSEYIDDDIDSLARWAGSTVVDKEQFKTVVAKMWELFKQQKEK